MSGKEHPTETTSGTAAATGSQKNAASTEDRGFEVKRRRRLPIVIGIIVIVVLVAGGLIARFTVGNAQAAGTKDHFGTSLKVAYLSTDSAQQTFVEWVAKNVAPAHGITIVPTGIGDPNTLSQAVNDGKIAGTEYAHKPWIDESDAANHWKITSTEPVFQWAYSIYSTRHASIKALPDGATIGILDDPANTAQALILLSRAGLIGLDPSVDPSKSTLNDVTKNPRHFVLKPIAFGSAARTLGDFDAIVTYNFEFNAAGIGAKARIYAPPAPRVFAAQLAIGTPYLKDASIKKLIETFKDPKVAKYLATTTDPKVKGQLTPVSAK
ncbi:MAG: D-methionine transport system substrate-binding protein [Actinomycetota bacterium]|jgi:ABC-type metal ion transport system substrate-binding protein|nr:D-methionine transport system substrate-binding protein [Actinomycetota bacterium]